jgi:hypothetical protein
VSDEELPASGEAVRGWASVKSGSVGITDEERRRRRAEISAKAEKARTELAERGIQSLAGQVQANTEAVASHEAQLAELAGVPEAIAAIRAGLAAAFEDAGREAPAALQQPQVRPELKVIRGGLAS